MSGNPKEVYTFEDNMDARDRGSGVERIKVEDRGERDILNAKQHLGEVDKKERERVILARYGFEAIRTPVLFSGINISFIISRYKKLQAEATMQWDRYCEAQAEMWTEVNKLISIDVEKARAWKLNQRHTSDYLGEDIKLSQLTHSHDMTTTPQNMPLHSYTPVAGLNHLKDTPHAFHTVGLSFEKHQGFAMSTALPLFKPSPLKGDHMPSSTEITRFVSSPNKELQFDSGSVDYTVSTRDGMEIKSNLMVEERESADEFLIKEVGGSSLKRKANEELECMIVKKIDIDGEGGVVSLKMDGAGELPLKMDEIGSMGEVVKEESSVEKVLIKKISPRARKLYRGARDKEGEKEWKPTADIDDDEI